MAVNATRYTLAEMDSETWTFNMLHKIAFPLAMESVQKMFDETDKYALANQMVKAGVLDKVELDDFFNRFTEPDHNTTFEMYPEDILILYTVLDLNAKLFFTPKDDELRSLLKLDTEKTTGNELQKGYDGMLTICSRFAQSLKEEYKHVAEFKERFAALENLSDYL